MAVELHARALFHIGIASFTEPLSGFLAVDDRPAQAALAMIGFERRKVMPMATAERGVFLEQTLVHIEAERLGFVVGVTGFDLIERKLVDLTVAIKHVEQGLAAIFRLLRNQFLGPHF